MGKVRPAISSRPQSVDSLSSVLDRLSHQYNSEFLETDPLKFPYRYKNRADQEIVGFISAMLAFGNVQAIFKSVEAVLAVLGPSPSQFLLKNRPLNRALPLGHRWVRKEDLVGLFRALGQTLRTEGSIEGLFIAGRLPTETLREGIERASGILLSRSGVSERKGLRFLIASPKQGGAAKRWNLFLRWVVRKGTPDLGLWDSYKPAGLFLPVDTHLARIVRYVGLTQLRTVNWRFVEEVTAGLRQLDPNDPIRFDFALSRLGILKECRHRPDRVLCPKCPLFDLCVIGKRVRPTLTALTR